ncbi:MAG TPA: hypothetical protein VFF04_01080 [Candidatus Babeliales bacterium]|nr:hypothetical protein [Candidatus Babeliales bacterium]
MKLQNLLEHLQSSSDIFSDKQIICFKSSYYPVLFFSLLIAQLKEKYSSAFETLIVYDHELAAIFARLEMSFLGSRTIFWLRGLDELDDKNRKKLFSYLSTYAGPNAIILSVEEVPAQWLHTLVIEVPEKVDKKLFNELIELQHKGIARKYKSIINALFASVETITLDDAYSLLRYLQVVGNSQEQFIHQWLSSLVVPEQSLFTLSQHFFAKEPDKFFPLWATIEKNYADIFWINFWSEQLWRACMAVRFMKENQFAQAKAVSYRLPFSFTQRDWKKVSAHELQRAHSYIYQLDYSLKNGGSIGSLEVFYTHFFLSRFNAA